MYAIRSYYELFDFKWWDAILKIHEYNNVRLVEEDCITFNNGILFLGFSGPGMVGLITTDMLNRLLDMLTLVQK